MPIEQQTTNQPTSIDLQLLQRLEGIFSPTARERRDSLYIDKSVPARFAHYTSADAALKIIQTKRLWLRNTVCMGDYREVHHGFDTLQQVIQDGDRRERLVNAFNELHPGLAEESFGIFDRVWDGIRWHTYIASISEHNQKEDFHGRLSMWRAFGGTAARVAIVVKVPWISEGSEELNLSLSPVLYFTEGQVAKEMDEVIANVSANGEFLRTVDKSLLVGSIFSMLLAAVTCMKHEGFEEEREWRAIYGPTREASQLMEQSIETIAGVPQTVFKIPLDSSVSPKLAGLDFAQIFDRLIIGPTQYAAAMHTAFAIALSKIGVTDADRRVFVSGIPIRT